MLTKNILFLALASSQVLLLILSFIAIGLMIRACCSHYLNTSFKPKYNSVQNFFTTGLLGALLMSQLTIYLLIFGIFFPEIYTPIKILSIAYLVCWCYQERHRFYLFDKNTILIMAFALALILVVTSASLQTPIPHGDARQYHLALPWQFSLGEWILIEPSLMQTGIYLGYDVFYLLLGDLSTLIDDPFLMVTLKLFSAISPVLLLAGTYHLGRQFGLNRLWSFLSAVSIMTMGSLFYWGSLKNDLVVAGVALFAVIQLQKSWDNQRTSDLYWSVAIGSFAVSIKVSILIPLTIPFIVVFLSGKFKFRVLAKCLLLGLLLLFPWFVYSLLTQSNPIYPLAGNLPPEIEAAWVSRNNNGLERNLYNGAKQFLNILLGKHPIPGNYTVGYLFVTSLFICIIVLTVRTARGILDIRDAILVGALLWFTIFYYTRFDGRFLSRYIVYCGSIFFVYAIWSIFDQICGLKKLRNTAYLTLSSGLAVLVFILAWNSPFTQNQLSRANSVLQLGISGWSLEWHRTYTEWTNFHRNVNHLSAGAGVAVNDHFILFLKGPVLNLHAMHAANLNLYNKDYQFIKDILATRGIQTLVVRRKISGMTSALEEFINYCTDKVEGTSYTQGTREVYRIKPSCKVPN